MSSTIYALEGEGRPTGGEQISPAVAASEETWKPVEIWTDMIGISGGFNKKPMSASCIKVQQGVETHRFVHLNTADPWFLKGFGGRMTDKRAMKAVNVVEVIRARIKSLFEVGEEPDREESTILEVNVPRSPDCVGLGEAMKITVYLRGSGQRNWCKRPIYLCVDGLDWLLSYAAQEHVNQGVKRRAVDELVKKANCAAVADLNLEWDLRKRVWKAEFVSGPLQGTTRRFGTSDLTKKRSKKMEVAGIGQISFQSYMSNFIRQKKQARDFIVLWCDAISKGKEQSFEVNWDINETTGQGLRKLSKRQKRK